MEQYHRLIHIDEPQPDRAALEKVMESAPGVSNVVIVGSHPKGGYETRFRLASDTLGSLIAYMEESGWRSVL
ncbi:hypothetical protein [Qipengyuania sp. DGS5-3]|uniref:hypothetical protein n=1 Tax=Qipengyuania sp. DGS5-3 TaxID=3349632 RepID=UPI0036D3A2AC